MPTKTALLTTINQLALPPELTDFLVNLVNTQDITPELLTSIAEVLTATADVLDSDATYLEDMSKIITQYKADLAKSDQQYASDVTKVLAQIKSSLDQSTSSVLK